MGIIGHMLFANTIEAWLSKHVKNKKISKATYYIAAIFFAFASHFLLDMMWHYDGSEEERGLSLILYGMEKSVPDLFTLLGVLLGMRCGLYSFRDIYRSHFSMLVSFLGFSPDILTHCKTILYTVGRGDPYYYRWFLTFHGGFHAAYRPAMWGISIHMLVAYLSLLCMLFILRRGIFLRFLI